MAQLKDVHIGEAHLTDKPKKIFRFFLRNKSVTKEKLDDNLRGEIEGKAENESFQEHIHNKEIHVTGTDKVRWDNKQDKLWWDGTPTKGSDRPVRSNGIYEYVRGISDSIRTYFLSLIHNEIKLSKGLGTDHIQIDLYRETGGEGDEEVYPMDTLNIPAATVAAAGVMSAEDKNKLDGIPEALSNIFRGVDSMGGFANFDDVNNPPIVFAQFKNVLEEFGGGIGYKQASAGYAPRYYLLLSAVRRWKSGTVFQQLTLDMDGNVYTRSIDVPNDNLENIDFTGKYFQAANTKVVLASEDGINTMFNNN